MHYRLASLSLVACLTACQNLPDYHLVKKSPVKAGVQTSAPVHVGAVIPPPPVQAGLPMPPAASATPPGAPMVIRVPPTSPQPPHNTLADGKSVPAVQGLLVKANDLLAKNDLEEAANLLERAQRLAPQSASVYQKLAETRLRQNRTAEAEQLARKGLAFAVSNGQQATLWRLLAAAAERQGKLDVSLQAKAKAEQLEAMGDRG